MTLRAVVDRIIPSDEFPSGWESGVGNYLSRQFHGDLQTQLNDYQQGLAAIEEEAMNLHNAPFSSLSNEQMDTILTSIEQGIVTTEWSVHPKQFFQMMVNHCAEGFYSNPENGGNRDSISWKMIGFEVTA